MGNVRHFRGAKFLHRILAASCAALIFILGLFAASPVLHRQLHHSATPSTGDDCAIVLFADGVSVPTMVTAVPPPPAEWQTQPYARLAELLVESPSYLLQPGRGPPIG